MAEQLIHKALAETHDFHIALALGIKIRSALAAAYGQACERVFEDLLKPQELDDAKVHRRMQPQTTLIGADSAVKLHSHAAVNLHFALIIHPGHPENNLPLWLYQTLEDSRRLIFRLLLKNRSQGFQNLFYCLQKLGLIWVLCLDRFIDSLCICHFLFLLLKLCFKL